VNIYVGNLPFSVRDNELSELFSEYGEVKSANVIMDRSSGLSKGYGFVEMDDKNSAEEAIQYLNGKEVKGRELRVNEARPRPDKRR
jgi:RNA recognition motif-containing protein|tara:strand:- start:479 stop:736 length:258 start_codon:yes stop_codon:yes gene_type:complete